MAASEGHPSDFIREMIAADVKAGKHGGKVTTRFPPEPNGYLHIGHAKSICLNFGVARELGGVCHLRMDDTNPTTEDPEYVAAIQRDVRWLGFDWADKMFYASDYFERLYELAEKLIQLGRAYVCDLTEEEMARDRGTITAPGRDSPYRSRSAEESLALFRRMRAGEFAEGAKTLRARINMASPNMKMRDPPIYRIKKARHYRTGDAWCIYPLYDFAHCLSDSIEGITHSLCTMEFESARELYDWVVAATESAWVPRQTEFARLNLSYTVMSKRKLLELVEENRVNGWDDPRLPTIAGLRRRGCTPEAIRDFCARIGVAKNLSIIDIALLEHSLRDDLDARSPRVMGVLRPVKLIVESLPPETTEELEAPYWPPDLGKSGSRKLPFARELYIEREDFAESPPKDFHRLAPGRLVRLRHAYIVKCTGFTRDARGELLEVRCTHDPATRGGAALPGQKVEGTVHWVSALHALKTEVRLYDRLFVREEPGVESGDFRTDLNPASLEVVEARVEPSLATAQAGEHFQFERQGFFLVDPDSRPGAPVFIRTVTLKDSWARQGARASAQSAAAPRPVDKPRAQPAPVQSPLSDAARALQQKLGVSADEARALEAAPTLLALLEQALAAGAAPGDAASLICNDLVGEMRARKLERAPFPGSDIAELVQLTKAGTLSSRLAKGVLGQMLAGGGSPAAIVKKGGLTQISDGAELEAVARKVVAANPDLVARFKAGNANVLGALLGMAMRESGGRGNPKALKDLLEKAMR